MLFLLEDDESFPPVNYADEYGLLAVGGDLSLSRVIKAYKSGIFPWSDDPPMWYAPDPRMLADLANYKPSKTLKRRLNKNEFDVYYDRDFTEVMKQCAISRSDTWISEQFIETYTQLHQLGLAHSIECYKNDTLVGGLYGLSFGSVFFGESMFYKQSDASKYAFHHLIELARKWDFTMVDCQVPNDHLIALACQEVDRDTYMNILNQSLERDTKQNSWYQSSPALN